MLVTVEQAVKIENSTRLQSLNTDWAYHRSLRLTSTVIKSVATAIDNKSEGYDRRRTQLAAKIVHPRDISTLPAIRRGKELEPAAIKFFLECKKEEGWQIVDYPVGFVVHPVECWLGASPDRYLFVTEPSGENYWALLEVKTFDLKKTLHDVGHLKEKFEISGEIILTVKPSHQYYVQVQTAILCTGLRKSFLVTFCSEDFENHICQIAFDEKTCALIVRNGAKFYFKYNLTKLASQNK